MDKNIKNHINCQRSMLSSGSCFCSNGVIKKEIKHPEEITNCRYWIRRGQSGSKDNPHYGDERIFKEYCKKCDKRIAVTKIYDGSSWINKRDRRDGYCFDCMPKGSERS